MKIKSLVETSAGATSSGSVASVASPMGKTHKRTGSMFKGKKTNKPFYEEKKDCGCPNECKCRDNVTEGKVKQLMMDLEEMSDKEFLKKYNKTKQEMRNSLNEGAMPQSVIKTKEKIRMASDEENKKRFAGKSKEELATMARRHGYKDKNPYAKFHDGTTGTNESKILKGMLEADLHEDDLILMPGQGARFRKELMPKKTDHEVEMARGQLYQSAKNAKDICDMLEGISEMEGIDAWVQSKITTAADYLETVRTYLESKYEMQHEVDEATAHEKFKKSVKKRGYDMDAGASRLERLLAKQAKERAEFEKKYASAYGTKEVDEDLQGMWDTVKSGASKAADYISNIGYGSPEEYGQSLAAANAGVSAKEYSKMYAKQLADRPEWQKEQSRKMEREKSQVGYKPYPKDSRPMPTNEEELNEFGYSSPEEYGKAIAAGNKYVPPAQKQAAPAGPSLWDRAKGVAASLRPFDEKTAASNFGYKPQQVAQAKTAPQTPMYEEGSDTNFGSTVTKGSWVVYDGNKVKRFKSRTNAKAYAEKNGGKVASSEFYADKIQKQGVDEGEQRMSRAAKGNEKYGKDGMKALAKAGREGASEKKMDAIRDKHDNYSDDLSEQVEGLWANIHAKQNRIKNGSGERMRKPGSKGAPTKAAFKKAKK